MGLFKALVKAVFGKMHKFEVNGLGVFTCKMCDWWPDEHYLWFGMVRLPIYSEETAIMLEGDVAGPSQRNLEGLRALLQNWKSMTAQLDRMLPEKSQPLGKEEVYASWQEQFYPEDINSAEQDKEGWEITFIRTDESPDYFFFTWKNNAVYDLTLSDFSQ